MYASVGEVNIIIQKNTVKTWHWAPTQDSPRKTILKLFKATLTYAEKKVWFNTIITDSSLSDLKAFFHCDYRSEISIQMQKTIWKVEQICIYIDMEMRKRI